MLVSWPLSSTRLTGPIEGAAYGTQVFNETREGIERLLGGTPRSTSAAQTGEAYRQTLRKAPEADWDRIAHMTWKVGSARVLPWTMPDGGALPLEA